jgi:hypothetical protein
MKSPFAYSLEVTIARKTEADGQTSYPEDEETARGRLKQELGERAADLNLGQLQAGDRIGSLRFLNDPKLKEGDRCYFVDGSGVRWLLSVDTFTANAHTDQFKAIGRMTEAPLPPAEP